MNPELEMLIGELPDALRALVHYMRTNCRGPANAIHAGELAAEFRVAARTINARAHDLRMKRIPICGDPDAGYYWPRSQDDTRRTILGYQSREEQMREARQAMEDGVDLLFGPRRLFA